MKRIFGVGGIANGLELAKLLSSLPGTTGPQPSHHQGCPKDYPVLLSLSGSILPGSSIKPSSSGSQWEWPLPSPVCCLGIPDKNLFKYNIRIKLCVYVYNLTTFYKYDKSRPTERVFITQL